ncbi:DUF3017 domain-containing protein [Alloscardovia venturai]|uniref:DUF3017 domain-containing protein n=1 Tax=Alloscardovia venturai TaxID=1769421 RepID=A0ABW2Y3Z9_9BIFI
MKPNHIEPAWPSITSLLVVVISAITAWFGFVNIATGIIALFSFIIGTCRVVMKEKAPWKIRSISFDVFISYALTLGLIITYISIIML